MEELFNSIIDLSLESNILYLYTEPEILDPNSNSNNIVICNSKTKVTVNLDQCNIIYISELLHQISLNLKSIITWNIKNLFSFLRFKNSDIKFYNFYDLKILERFFDIHQSRPETFQDAYNRLKRLDLKKAAKIYKSIYCPLIADIVPHMEQLGVYYGTEHVHPYYEIEGQDNGRLSCSKSYLHGINAHTLSEDIRKELKLYGFNRMLVYLDYKALEVRVLQWLSKDKCLGDLIKSGKDLYKSIFELVQNRECTSVGRKIIKSIFLPVIYGMNYHTLAEKIKISDKSAIELINRFRFHFPEAFSYVESINFVNNTCYDYFGRNRNFPEKQYRARNFMIQSPAALLCLSKLVLLYNNIKDYADIVFSVHDGYYVSAHNNDYLMVLDNCFKILKSESELFPGLNLDVSCYYSKDFINFKEVYI